jgi:hypothetical protein
MKRSRKKIEESDNHVLDLIEHEIFLKLTVEKTEKVDIASIIQLRTYHHQITLMKDTEDNLIEFKEEHRLEKPREKEVEEHLKILVNSCEVDTHCCECTPGPHFERHAFHIQYPKGDCKCKKEDYVKPTNEIG